jgi:sugar phosphate isomerase/epimerase
MKATLLLLSSALLALAAPSHAQDSPGGAAADRFVLAKVRLLPKPGQAKLLAGATIRGSAEGQAAASVELARIDQAPSGDGWLEVSAAPGKVYRYLKVESAKGTGMALAEVEFLSRSGRIKGGAVGSVVAGGKPATAFGKALDGDPNTSFESPTGSSYVGIDLGWGALAPAPHFNPPGGAFAAGPQKVEIGAAPGSAVRYTTDGSVPGPANGQAYGGPIQVAATTSIAAVASREGLVDSEVAIAVYRLGPGAIAERQVRSYHVGNSLTDTVDGFLSPIALSAGRNFLFMRKTIPGAGIQMNFETCGKGFGTPDAAAADYKAMFEKKIDHLFLQPFPNPPGLDSDGKFGGQFIELARKSNPQAEAWLYTQWPAWDSWRYDAHCTGAGWMKPPWSPPNPKPANWEEAMANKMLYFLALKAIWDKQAQERGEKPARLCPGGPALVRLKKAIEAGSVPGISNFHDTAFADDIHLARQGRYLVALVHYACIFGDNPQGKVTFANSGLTAEQAAIFQRIAWETVVAEPLTARTPELYAFCMDVADEKHRSLPEQARMLRELGFDGAAYSLWFGEDLDRNLRTLDEAGLKPYMLETAIDIAQPDNKRLDVQIPEAFGKLKGRPVTISVQLKGFPAGDPRGEESAIAVLRRLGDQAAAAGLRISIYNHVDTWTESVLFSLKIARKVDHPQVGVNFNLCHWLKVDGQKDYRPVLRDNAGRIFVVTINGAKVGSKPWTNGLIQPLGQGDFDNRQLLATLRDAGYRGPVGVMCYGIPGDAGEYLQRSMKVWRAWDLESAKK